MICCSIQQALIIYIFVYCRPPILVPRPNPEVGGAGPMRHERIEIVPIEPGIVRLRRIVEPAAAGPQLPIQFVADVGPAPQPLEEALQHFPREDDREIPPPITRPPNSEPSSWFEFTIT